LVYSSCLVNRKEHEYLKNLALSGFMKRTTDRYGNPREDYLNGHVLISDPFALHAAARIVHWLMKHYSADIIGGEELAACAIVSATVAYSAATNFPVKGFYVRKSPKKYGYQSRLSIEVSAGQRVFLVDDVVKSGKSLYEVANLLRKLQLTPVGGLVLVDRGNGIDSLSMLDFPVLSLLSESDLT
jgi:orotate phosphoribosyltransferase